MRFFQEHAPRDGYKYIGIEDYPRFNQLSNFSVLSPPGHKEIIFSLKIAYKILLQEEDLLLPSFYAISNSCTKNAIIFMVIYWNFIIFAVGSILKKKEVLSFSCD